MHFNKYFAIEVNVPEECCKETGADFLLLQKNQLKQQNL